MAFRRSTQKAQVIAQLQQIAPPGEQFLACVHCETGPSPWLGILFDEIPFLGFIVQMMRRFYFITVTSSHVVMNSASRYTNRPGPVIYSFPRDQFPLVTAKRASMWSSLYVQLPNQPKPTRLNVARYWRVELDQMMASLPAPAQMPIPTQPGAPTQTPTPQQ